MTAEDKTSYKIIRGLLFILLIIMSVFTALHMAMLVFDGIISKHCDLLFWCAVVYFGCTSILVTTLIFWMMLRMCAEAILDDESKTEPIS